MESLDELRATINELQNDTDLLKKRASDPQRDRKLEVVGKDITKLSRESQQLLEKQWRVLQGYLGGNFTGVKASSAPLDTSEWQQDWLTDIAQSGETPDRFDLASLTLAQLLDKMAMSYYFVKLPDWKLLKHVDRILNNRRDQQTWTTYLEAELKLLREFIKADPKGVSELIRKVGKSLCDQLGEFTASVGEFLEKVVFIVAEILGNILKYGAEVGEHLAKIAGRVSVWLLQIPGSIEQDPAFWLMITGGLVVVVVNILEKSRVRLKDLVKSEND